MYKYVFIIGFAFLALACKQKQQPTKPDAKAFESSITPEKYLCQKVSNSIKLDGVLDEPAWEKASWSNKFVNIEGRSYPAPTWDTKVKMLWDDSYLYIAAELIEPHIWAKLTLHDTVLYHDDVFEVFIDPDGDTHDYYEFQINALETIWDLFMNKPYRDGGQADSTWEVAGLLKGIDINGTINDPLDKDEKWTIELAFPWEAFKHKVEEKIIPEVGDQWRMNFSRVDWQVDIVENRYVKRKDDMGNDLPERYWVWSPQGVVALHQPETWGYVLFAKEEGDEFISHKDEEVKEGMRRVYQRQNDS